MALVRSAVPPMHREGLPFVGVSLAVAAIGRNNPWLRRAGLASAVANAAFFRHPPRVPPTRPGLVVAPADGLVCLVDEEVPPAELGLPATPLPRISIFLSVLDAHVQRAPIGGEVVDRGAPPRAVRVRRPGGRQRRQRTQQHRDPHPGRRRGGRGADRRAAGAADRLQRQGRRQAGDRRHLRPDPVRLPAGHLPACGLQRPGHHRPARRWPAKPYWPSCR